MTADVVEAHRVTFHGPIFRKLPTISHPIECDGEHCPVLSVIEARIRNHEEPDQVDGIYRPHVSDGRITGFVRIGARP